MSFDFANPPVSRVTSDLSGVAILLWGANGTGKTPIACGMPKPYYLAFESGLTGIDGVPYAPMKSWKDFVSFVKWATSPVTTEKAHEICQTVVLDTLDVMADYCIDYTCARFNVSTLGETRLNAEGKRDGSINLYTEFGREFRRQTRALRNAGFTLVYIAHDGGYRDEVDPKTQQKYTKMYPAGDKRAVEPICNDVDVIGYLRANPLDDHGNPVYSTIYFAPNTQYHTRSRYDEIVPLIEHVTANDLCKAIVAAKQAYLTKHGSQSVTFQEQQAAFQEAPHRSFEEVVSEIGQCVMVIDQYGMRPEYEAILEKYLGKGKAGKPKGVQETTPQQLEVLEVILDEVHDLVAAAQTKTKE